MKIGLLTFHSAHNYGAVLQAYATQEKVKELGFDIEVIDYNPDYLVKQKVFPISSNNSVIINLKIIVEGLLTFPQKINRINGFNKFVKEKINLSKTEYKSIPFTENTDYDHYIMGSDQVWNCKLTKGFDPLYLGNFKTKPSAKKISYAASMSYFSLSSAEKIEFASLIQNFNDISVREQEVHDFLKTNFNQESTVVLDPTLLLDAKAWSTIAVNPNRSKKYILVYSIDLRNEAVRMATKIAKEINAEVIELAVSVDRNVSKNPFQTASPEEYVGLFKHAAFVVTSSFHGTAFSVIFNKPFYSIAHGGDRDSRQITVLENLGLIERFVSKNDAPSYKTLEYTIPNKKLEEMKKVSLHFLESNLKK